MNNQIQYKIISENELSMVLSNFNTEYIFSVLNMNIQNRFNCYQLNMPNIVGSFEQNFKVIMTSCVDSDLVEKTKQVREETYKEIISILCKTFGLQFINNDIIDYYSIAYHLYAFLVSDFKSNIVNFFTNFIIKEKNSLYESLKLNSLKKSKDTSTIYNKKLIKNQKLAIINTNLEYVIDNICCFDISYDALLNIIYQDKNLIKFIQTFALPIQDFFKVNYCSVMQSTMRPALITEIRLEIQKQSISSEIEII